MKLLITGAVTWEKEEINELKELGHEIIFIQDERISLDQQNINIIDINGVICNGLFLYNDITKFKNLKYIQLTSAGFDRVPMKFIEENEIKIYNARGVYSIPMAEFTLFGVLQFYKKSKFFYNNQQQKKWEKNRDIFELFGKEVCIIGCGNVGTECAKRFNAFGCNVIGIDIYPRKDENYKDMFALEKLDDILPKSDIVILTLPLTDKTRHLINLQKLELLKKDAILVNIARGAVIDTKALIKRLPYLGGVILDVFEEEPLLKDSSLWNMENVIITPHNSFIGEGNRKRLQSLILKNLKENIN